MRPQTEISITDSNTEISPEEQPFLDEIRANPDDDAARLVYADWLEERGEDAAAFLRWDVEWFRSESFGSAREESLRRLTRLLSHISESRLRQLYLSRAVRCTDEWTGCPGRWSQLLPPKNNFARLCGECDQVIFKVGSVADLYRQSLIGHSVCCDYDPEDGSSTADPFVLRFPG